MPSPPKNISLKEAEILIGIVEFVVSHKRFPTFREIMAFTGVSSTSMIRYYLKKYKQFGYINTDDEGHYWLTGLIVMPPLWYYHVKMQSEDIKSTSLDPNWSQQLTVKA